mgnify:CR=1 FL=1
MPETPKTSKRSSRRPRKYDDALSSVGEFREVGRWGAVGNVLLVQPIVLLFKTIKLLLGKLLV